MQKQCLCCYRILEVPLEMQYEKIYCDDCCKKIKKEVKKNGRRKYPFRPWKWLITTPKEVDEIVKNIQLKEKK